MYASIPSAIVVGVDGRPITVEVHVATGFPGLTIVGLPDTACREARDRVRAAVLAADVSWPAKRITINLAPSELRKPGAALDLAMAVGVLVANGDVGIEAVDGLAFVGELGLDGTLRRVTGMVPLVDAVRAPIVVVPAAGVEEAAALAAVTNGDNSNILVARVARETYGIERVVARIYDPRRAKIYERLGIPTIATVEWATERVLQRILPERPNASWIDPSAEVVLLERAVPARWAGHKVSDLDLPGHARIAAISRLGAGTVAHGDTVLQDGDVIHVMVGGDSIERFDERLSAPEPTGGR